MSTDGTRRIKVAIAGALGRTGRSTVETALADSRFEVVAALTIGHSDGVGMTLSGGQDSVVVTEQFPDRACDVLIDFSAPEGTMAWLDHCTRLGMAFVTGVTNLSKAQMSEVRRAGQSISIVLYDKNHRKVPDCSHVQRLMEFSFTGSTIACHHQGDFIGFLK